jgi:hypothetical protein
MPPKASAAEKGKGKRGAGGKDEAPLATLVARLHRVDLEALLLSYEATVPSMRADVTAKLQPEQARAAAYGGARMAHDHVLCPSSSPLRRASRAA